MVNRWIEHIRKYAKENNIPYGCAISKARETYVKAPKLSKIEELRKYYPDNLKAIIKKLIMYDNKGDLETGINFIKQIIEDKSKPDDFKKYFKENNPKAYNIVYKDDNEPKEPKKKIKKTSTEIKKEYEDADRLERYKKNMKDLIKDFKDLPLKTQKLRFESLPAGFQEYIKDNNPVLYNLIK